MFGRSWCWIACCIPIPLSRMSRFFALLSYIRLVCCLGIAVNVCLLASSWFWEIHKWEISLTFIGPCIANIFAEYNQQDATFHNLFISVRRCTCFRRFFRPSSGAQNCTYSVRYLSDQYCYLTNTWSCMCSFELLMMDGKAVWNMYSVLQK